MAYFIKRKKQHGNTIPISQMYVEESYQRDPAKKFKAIAREWDVEKVGVIRVSYIDGKFDVVDGQNRVLAARIAGEEYLPCQIATGSTKINDAITFAHQDDNKSFLSTYDKFKASLFAGDGNAVGLKNLCGEYGIRIRKASQGSKGVLRGLAVAMKLYKCYGEGIIRFIFNTIAEAVWGNETAAYSDTVIRALGNVYNNHKHNLDEARTKIVDAICTASPRYIMAEALVKYVDRGRNGALTKYFEDIIDA